MCLRSFSLSNKLNLLVLLIMRVVPSRPSSSSGNFTEAEASFFGGGGQMGKGCSIFEGLPNIITKVI